LEESLEWHVYPRKTYGSAAFFNNSYRQIEQHDLLVNNILCNSEDAKRFTKECISPDRVPLFDACDTQFGTLYHLWTADLVASPIVRSGFVMILGAPDTIGAVSVRQEPAVVYDEKGKRFIAFMDNAYSVINRYAGVVNYALGAGWRKSIWA